jgi:hypothetical protein
MDRLPESIVDRLPPKPHKVREVIRVCIDTARLAKDGLESEARGRVALEHIRLLYPLRNHWSVIPPG